jgi:hypothetical protein
MLDGLLDVLLGGLLDVLLHGLLGDLRDDLLQDLPVAFNQLRGPPRSILPFLLLPSM